MGKCYGGILTTILDNFSLLFKPVLVNLKYPERALRNLRRILGTVFWVSCLPAGTLRYTERSKLLLLRATIMTQSTHLGQDSWWQTQFLRWAFLIVRKQLPGPEIGRKSTVTWTSWFNWRQSKGSTPVAERGDPKQGACETYYWMLASAAAVPRGPAQWGCSGKMWTAGTEPKLLCRAALGELARAAWLLATKGKQEAVRRCQEMAAQQALHTPSCKELSILTSKLLADVTCFL